MELIEKTAFVTCVCSGLGQAIATKLYHAGASVYINESDESHGVEVTAALESSGNNFIQHCNFFELNVMEDRPDRIIPEKFILENAIIDILVNVVGCEHSHTAGQGQTRSDMKKLKNVNEAFIPLMNTREGSRIINVAVGRDLEKRAADSTRALSARIAKKNINVNCLLLQSTESRSIQQETAEAVLFLAGVGSSHITGEVLHLHELRDEPLPDSLYLFPGF